MWHKERSLWVPERKLYYGFPVPGVVASVGGGGTPLSEGNTGLVIASAGANVNDGGSTAWTTPGNITSDATPTARATCFRSSTGTSQLLRATFDLSAVPDTATITGVIVNVARDYASSVPPQTVRDHTVRLTKDGTNMVGDNLADTVSDWAHLTEVEVVYGGSSNLWGLDGDLTAAEVKAANFGVMFKASLTGTTSINARVNAMWMNVHYLS